MDLKRFLKKHGLDLAQDPRVDFDEKYLNLWPDVVRAFQLNGQYSFIGELADDPVEILEALAIASSRSGFRLSAIEVEGTGEKARTLMLASENRVYQFSLPGSGTPSVEPLCDILNHCLKRQSSKGRFVVVTSSIGSHVLFGSPDLLKGLCERFGIDMPNADYYLGLRSGAGE